MSKHFYLGWLWAAVLALLPWVGLANSDAPMPKVEEVLKRAIERGKLEPANDLKFKQQYYFVRSRKTEIRNSEGEIKKSKFRVSTNAPLATISASNARAAAADSKAEVPAEVAGKFDKKQFQFNQDLANRFDFKLVGREQTNGISLLVVDFAPKKTKLPEKGIQDRVINRMAGRVWVDERDYAIKKCALNLTESISIVGGIVGEAQKFHYAFDRERTEDGLWYVRESSWHLEGRQVVVHREADYHEKRTEVRKHVSVQ
jgi:hypothetical protein